MKTHDCASSFFFKLHFPVRQNCPQDFPICIIVVYNQCRLVGTQGKHRSASPLALKTKMKKKVTQINTDSDVTERERLSEPHNTRVPMFFPSPLVRCFSPVRLPALTGVCVSCLARLPETPPGFSGHTLLSPEVTCLTLCLPVPQGHHPAVPVLFQSQHRLRRSVRRNSISPLVASLAFIFTSRDSLAAAAR
ncbi:hypothetical protein F2P81_018821 [Scophthalmus maximus]|uniref:Uncharacterized protein n=1 Tax=Scophthalmus maximus TaxID=52904 RepID=A0A6A4S3C5_SCOMX|nr:hypothetical protein F2P81_018821 [Scophthalmus maximus]